jgi:hypothetical protein
LQLAKDQTHTVEETELDHANKSIMSGKELTEWMGKILGCKEIITRWSGSRDEQMKEQRAKFLVVFISNNL